MPMQAQLLDDQRLLIHWCAPEMLAAPHRHHGCDEPSVAVWIGRSGRFSAGGVAGRSAVQAAPVSAVACGKFLCAICHPCVCRHSSASHAAQAGGGAYLMLYNYSTAAVERLFVAGSPDLATWWAAVLCCAAASHV